jgi:hypothetical protein
MTPRDRYDRVVLNASVAAIFVLLFFSISSLLLPGVAFCHDYLPLSMTEALRF